MFGSFNNNIFEYTMNFVPLDSDVLSMELPLCYSDCMLHGDRSDLHYAAGGLMQLQVWWQAVLNTPELIHTGPPARPHQ